MNDTGHTRHRNWLERNSTSIRRRVAYLYTRALCRWRPPIFVLGNQKSGTTSIAAMLGARAGLQVSLDFPGEVIDPVFDQIQTNQISFDRFVYKNIEQWRAPIIKEPNLSLLFDEIQQYFPQARFVFIVRHPLDNIRSILNRLNLPGDKEALSDEQLDSLPLAWKKIVFNSGLAHLQSDHYVESLALRWQCIANVYRSRPESMVLVRYEDFCTDKTGVVDSVCATLGLSAQGDIAHLLDHQFHSRGQRDVDLTAFYGERNLNLITNLCRDGMEYFEYD